MDDRLLRVDTADGRCRIALHHPPLNVLTLPLMTALGETLEALDGEPLHGVVLTGTGEKAFSAGVDVAIHTPDRVEAMLGTFHRVFRLLWRLPVPTVALVNGAALGGGCELAGFCDFVAAAEEATFGLPEITLGCYPPLALAHFPARLGARAAAELIWTGRPVSAARAAAIGLVNRVAPRGELEAVAGEWLDPLARHSRPILGQTVRLFRDRLHPTFEADLAATERAYFRELMRTPDAAEGIAAFMEKRAPRWSHRDPE